MSLKITLITTILIFLVELILMFHKHHFYNILVYIAILAIFFMNYFDKHYMKFCLVNLGIATILDFIWLIVQADVIIFFMIEFLEP